MQTQKTVTQIMAEINERSAQDRISRFKSTLKQIETEDEVIEIVRELALYLTEINQANGDKFSEKTSDVMAKALQTAIKFKGQ